MINQSVIDNSWEQVKRFWTHLNLNEPLVYAKEEKENLGAVIACFDSANRQIYIDEENLEKRLGVRYFRPVLNHEAGHHKMCPYGLKGFVRLVAHAYNVVKNVDLAQTVENLFGDILINTHLYKKGERSIKEVYQRFSEKDNSKVWQFYMSTFENMLGEPNSILKKQPDEKMKKNAKRIGDILSKSLYNSDKWPESITEFAKCIKEYIAEDKKKEGAEKEQQGNRGQQGQPQSSSRQGQQQQSKDGQEEYEKGFIDKHEVDDFLPFDKDKTSKGKQAKYIEKEVKGLATEVGLDTFKEVMGKLGFAKGKQAKIWFYRDLASLYSLDMPKEFGGTKTSIPRIPKKWRVSDPIELLNVEYSLSNFGILVPNVTTYKFVSEECCCNSGVDAPDLLIVLDVSPSMPNPDVYISFPDVSAMIASQAALECGKKVGVITFSDMCEYLDFTNNSDKVDELLTSYHGGGTVIPGNKIRELVARHNYPVHVLIISDTAISNLTNEIDNLEYTLKKGGAGGTIFLDCEPSEKTRLLSDIGFDVQFTRNFDDLAGLAIRKTRALYNAYANGEG